MILRLVRIVQTLDSAIRWINHYPIYKYYPGIEIRIQWIALSTFWKTGASPFLESPGNFSDPKSNIQIEI